MIRQKPRSIQLYSLPSIPHHPRKGMWGGQMLGWGESLLHSYHNLKAACEARGGLERDWLKFSLPGKEGLPPQAVLLAPSYSLLVNDGLSHGFRKQSSSIP